MSNGIYSFEDFKGQEMSDCDCVFTKDTNRKILQHDGIYFNEASGEYYDNKIRLLIDCLKGGMTKEELRLATNLDPDDDVDEAGYIFWTTFEENQSCDLCNHS